MKDSVLKETGNSRYLKTSIPDTVTWSEALTMMRNGTFPIDLLGINPDGFDQVGTPLNKANLLTDETAAKAGLDDTATPNQFQDAFISAVKSGEESDADYHLGFYLDENGDLCQVDDEE